ncbi:MAG: peroxidase [Planctomycetota bacterium]
MANGELLQEGIYHAPGQRPPEHATFVFLRARESHSAADVYGTLKQIWSVLQQLRQGRVPSVPGVTVPTGNLSSLIGYGYNIFTLQGIKKDRPASLGDDYRYLRPEVQGGGVFLRGSGLRYAEDVAVNQATEDIVIQCIGETRLSVTRPVVEIQTTLRGMTDPALEVAAVYTGFNRDDARSWIGFHDGISNIPSRHRWKAIETKTRGWTKGGTYMSFIRIAVNLAGWERLTTLQQETAVGRDKVTGCPFLAVDGGGQPIPAQGCPVSGSADILDPANRRFVEPTAPAVNDQVIIKSHVQRANNAHSTDWSSRSSLRVYRQGYEFFETGNDAADIRIGLNFISFQDTPERLIRILTQDQWLGGTNFGGETDEMNPIPELRTLLTVRAGANFLVPPKDPHDKLPGRVLFES